MAQGIARPKKAEYLEQYKKLQQNVVDTQGAELGAHDGWLSVTKDVKGAWTGMIFVGWESLEVGHCWYPSLQRETS